MISAEEIVKLREETGIGVMECKKALEEAKGDAKEAIQILQKKGVTVAAKKSGRTTNQGLVEVYVHGNGKIGVMLELACETDFVAKNPQFKILAHDMAMQIASMDPRDINELMSQDYIKDPSLKITGLVNQNIQQIGENIKVKRFVRYQLGQ